MEVLLAASEAIPFAKTGGLADVAGTLPLHLSAQGCRITLVHPWYRETKIRDLEVDLLISRMPVPLGDGHRYADVLECRVSTGVRVLFLVNDHYFDRERLYGGPGGDYDDNAERFAFFSRACLELCQHTGYVPDIIHCHDWQTALIPALLRFLYGTTPLRNAASVFTIHNMAYQGIFPAEDFWLTGLPGHLFSIRGFEFWGSINFMKGALVYADVLNTVSRRYSREIQTPEFGCGLEGVLQERSAVLYGVLNGVDYREWDPRSDRFTAAPYGPGDTAGKQRCRNALLRECALEPTRGPVVGIVSRLAEQKGMDLVMACIDDIVAAGCSFVLLGSGDDIYQRFFSALPARFPGRVAVKIGYDNRLAHLIEAGSDIFLMPSRFEPCGLNQMYSLRYGTVPVVHATGGLDDTIVDVAVDPTAGNGFKFYDYSATALMQALVRTIAAYGNRQHWDRIVSNGMQSDFSWELAATDYCELYRKARAVRTVR